MRRKKLKGKYTDIKVSSLSKFINKNKLKLITISSFLVVLGTILLINSPKDNIFKSSYKKLLANNGIYTEEIKSIDITSDDYDEPSSFKVTKSAEWTDYGKAKLTITADSIIKPENNNKKDIILVMDISGSMNGDKLDKAKEDAIDLTNKILSDNKNKIGLITFDTNADIVFNLTNDINTIIARVNSLTTKGNTNYNDALKKVDNMLENYQEQNNRDLIVLFLTDGNPCNDTPNEISTYKVLKEKYPSLTIQGIQYEMGSSITESLKNISDNQYNANIDNLGNILMEASTNPIPYEEFIITDFIDTDYFEVPSEENIKASSGSYELDSNKITWNLGDSYITGNKATLTVNLTQKEEYVEEEGFYPTNEKETIKYKLGEASETISSHDTPVLKNTYEVIYNTNAPEGCNVETPESEKYSVYTAVTVTAPELSCNGYTFKGWKIKNNNNIKHINVNIFKMPARDVIINGVWAKQEIIKKMNGTIREKPTLYRVFEKDASKNFIKEYTGEHADAYDKSGTKKIYYFYGYSSVPEKNNVIFANHCWQMFRTTDTGGVKMIYNGVADENGQCGTNRSEHIGYSGRSKQYLNSNYFYGTDYIYDEETKTFTLSGEKISAKWDNSNYQNLIGKYTCKNSSENGSCSTLYYIESYYSSTYAYVYPINSSSHYSQFGTISFNEQSDSSYSVSDVGYMHNTSYKPNYNGLRSSTTLLESATLSTEYYYADSYDYGETTSNRYTLTNPYKIDSTDEYPNLVGKYTFLNSSESFNNNSIYYIAGISNNNIYYIKISSGATLNNYDKTYVFGDGYVKNDDNTYTLTNTFNYKLSEWPANYQNINTGMYTCLNEANACSNLYYVYGKNVNTILYTPLTTYNYLYGSDVEYKYNESSDQYEYFLIDPIKSEIISSDSLSSHHYSCFNDTGNCTNVRYVYYYSASNIYYITLSDGKKSQDAFNEMLYINNVNAKNSVIKTAVDAWYNHYMLKYEKYLEDTVFCNNRSIRNMHGWNANAGNVSGTLNFREEGQTKNLSCENETDRFSMLNDMAKLKYPVGLISSPELYLINNKNAIKSNQNYWTMSPHVYYYTNALEKSVDPTGYISSKDVKTSLGVRPVISLKPGIEYSDGDGSKDHPYIIDMEGD